MPDGIHIASLTAHQIAGSLFIVEIKILLKQFAIDLSSHIIKNILGGSLKNNLV